MEVDAVDGMLLVVVRDVAAPPVQMRFPVEDEGVNVYDEDDRDDEDDGDDREDIDEVDDWEHFPIMLEEDEEVEVPLRGPLEGPEAQGSVEEAVELVEDVVTAFARASICAFRPAAEDNFNQRRQGCLHISYYSPTS